MESEAQAEIDSVKANLAAIQVLCQGFHRTAFLAKACGINSPSVHCLMRHPAYILMSMRRFMVPAYTMVCMHAAEAHGCRAAAGAGGRRPVYCAHGLCLDPADRAASVRLLTPCSQCSIHCAIGACIGRWLPSSV